MHDKREFCRMREKEGGIPTREMRERERGKKFEHVGREFYRMREKEKRGWRGGEGEKHFSPSHAHASALKETRERLRDQGERGGQKSFLTSSSPYACTCAWARE